MLWQSNPYSLPLLLSTMVSAAVIAVAWRRRPASGASTLSVLILAVAVWCGGYSAYWALAYGPAQLLALNLTTLGSALVPPAYLVFMLDVTGRRQWVTRRVRLALGLYYLLALLAGWTNGWHRLWNVRVDYQTVNGLHVVAAQPGPLYWLFALALGYGLTLFGTGLLVHAFWYARGVYRRQYGLLLLAVAVVLFPSLLSEAGLTPWPELDLAPLGLAVAGPLLAYALFYYRLLDLVPIARTRLVDIMQDAVIALDEQHRVVDINPEAIKLFSLTGSPIGQPARRVFADWPALAAHPAEGAEASALLRLDAARTLQVSSTLLYDPGGEIRGRLIVLRDVSALKRAEQELQAANAQLRDQLAQIETLQVELQEQAIRDPLTGLYNRRFLEEMLPRELIRARRDGQPLSLIFVDLDHFKLVNDQYGHAAGDQVLRAVSQYLAGAARASDVVCRYGGEEIVVVCPGMPLPVAELRADLWRRDLALQMIDANGVPVGVTVSAGIAGFPTHGDTLEALLAAADGALYAAKARGRNCVRVADLPPAAPRLPDHSRLS
jgi:diguanylate cyclase (GGDEF)-like protein